MSTLYVDNLQPNLGSRVMAAGHVVQVVQGKAENDITVSSLSLTDTGISLSITPSSSSSNVLVRFDVHTLLNGNAGGLSYAIYRSVGGGADTLVESYPQDYALYNRPAGSGTMQIRMMAPITKLDSPASTSSVTYKLYARYHTISTNHINSGGSTYITLQEIAQ